MYVLCTDHCLLHIMYCTPLYSGVIEQLRALELSRLAGGIAQSSSEELAQFSLRHALDTVMDAHQPPLSQTQRAYCEYHIETEFSGDWGEDPQYLSFLYYDGGVQGQYRYFAGGDRVLKGGYGALVQKLHADAISKGVVVHCSEKVVHIERSGCGQGAEGGGDASLVKVTTESNRVFEGVCVLVDSQMLRAVNGHDEI